MVIGTTCCVVLREAGISTTLIPLSTYCNSVLFDPRGNQPQWGESPSYAPHLLNIDHCVQGYCLLLLYMYQINSNRIDRSIMFALAIFNCMFMSIHFPPGYKRGKPSRRYPLGIASEQSFSFSFTPYGMEGD